MARTTVAQLDVRAGPPSAVAPWGDAMTRRGWLVGYDIASPHRLRRVHRFLVRRAMQVQYSLFVGAWTEAELREVLGGLGRLIDARRDDVRAWPLPERTEVDRFGRGVPDGIVTAISRPNSVAAMLRCAGATRHDP